MISAGLVCTSLSLNTVTSRDLARFIFISRRVIIIDLCSCLRYLAFFLLLLRSYNFNLRNFCPSQHIISTYCDPGRGQSNSLFSISSCNFLYHIPICSLVSPVVVLTSVPNYIIILQFSLPAFILNGQTSLIFVVLCNLLHSCVLLIHIIYCLFLFSMYRLFLL